MRNFLNSLVFGRTFISKIVFHIDLKVIVSSVVVHQVGVTAVLLRDLLVDMELYDDIDLSEKC